MSPIFCLLLMHLIHGQTQIWYEKMDTASTSWLGDAPTTILTNNALCPTPNLYCWAFDSGLSTHRTHSTMKFTGVQLVYSISTSTPMNGQDRCVIEYSTDGSTFNDIVRISTATSGITSFSTWGAAADNQTALTIRLSSMDGGGHTCYFNELTLQGTLITTAHPTSVPSIAPSRSPSQPPSAAPTVTPKDIVIQNLSQLQKWWIGIRIKYVNFSCGGDISVVELTDNVNYVGLWVPWTGPDPYQSWDQAHFTHRNMSFTAPLSLRITAKDTYNNTDQRVSYNVINSLEPEAFFDFGSNFCSPTSAPTTSPTAITVNPSLNPTTMPTINPTVYTTPPSLIPSAIPTVVALNPTCAPTYAPSTNPTRTPTLFPSVQPTINPTTAATSFPTLFPVQSTLTPTLNPFVNPTQVPSSKPSANPSVQPTLNPSKHPTMSPSLHPSVHPSVYPTANPTSVPTLFPTLFPTLIPIQSTQPEDEFTDAQNSHELTVLYIAIVALSVVLVGVLVWLLRNYWIRVVKQPSIVPIETAAFVPGLEETAKGNHGTGQSVSLIEIGCVTPAQAGEAPIAFTAECKDTSPEEAETDDGDGTEMYTGDAQKEVEDWLNEWNVRQYYDVFMENGMNSLEYIKCIETIQDLEHIGVMMKGHQIVIMAAIKKLNHTMTVMSHDAAADDMDVDNIDLDGRGRGVTMDGEGKVTGAETEGNATGNAEGS
eukprot:620461_1